MDHCVFYVNSLVRKLGEQEAMSIERYERLRCSNVEVVKDRPKSNTIYKVVDQQVLLSYCVEQ